MRVTFSAFLIIVLHCAFASAATTTIEAPILRLVGNVDQLHSICKARVSFDACTVFIGYRLETSCEQRGASWHMHVRASFRPWIQLYNVGNLSHELMHVEDVRAAVQEYATGLEVVDFTSAARCEASGLAEQEGFEGKMMAFVRASTLKRHPELATRIEWAERVGKKSGGH